MLSVPFGELGKFDGEQTDKKIYVSLLGVIYDCSAGGAEFFGEGEPYQVFAGKDASYALAMMALKEKDTNVFVYELDKDDLQTLSEWIAYFDAKYNRIGFLMEKAHPFSVGEMPSCPSKTMGGITYGGNLAQQEAQQALALQQTAAVADWQAAQGGAAGGGSSSQHETRKTRDGIAYCSAHIGAADQPAAACLLLLHCTGGNKGVWTAVVDALATLPLPPGVGPLLVVWPDFSGHGESRPYPAPFSTERGRRHRLRHLRPRRARCATERARVGTGADGVHPTAPAFCVGHSMGASAAVLAALERPGAFSRMLLYEPIVLEPPAEEPPPGEVSPMIAMTRKRRDVFASREDAVASFASKLPYKAFTPAAARHYLEGSVKPMPPPAGGGEGEGEGAGGGGAVTLACPKEYEAALYNGKGLRFVDRVREVRCATPAATPASPSTPAAAAPVSSVTICAGSESRQMDMMEGVGRLGRGLGGARRPAGTDELGDYPGLLTSRYYTRLAAEFASAGGGGGRYVLLAGAGHFGPMEQPAALAGMLAALVVGEKIGSISSSSSSSSSSNRARL